MFVGCMEMVSDNFPPWRARRKPDERQLLLRMKDLDIHVRIRTTRDQSRELVGRIQPRVNTNFSSASLHLFQKGERVNSAQLNEDGQFQFEYVPDGPLSLQLELPDMIAISAIE